MSTYTQIIYQIVFSTKYREKALTKNNRSRLFEYIIAVLQNKKCHVLRVNGVEDHIHILTHLHPTVPLSSLVKDIKIASSIFIKEKSLFKDFVAWQEGYGAFTYSFKDKDRLIEYVKSQEEHHKEVTSKEEYRKMLDEQGVEVDDKYFL
jgi:REP element-mobilizing transposase RayT